MAYLLLESASRLLQEDGTSRVLLEGNPSSPLLLTATLKAAEIAPPAPASPWSIDPNRSQELPPNYGT